MYIRQYTFITVIILIISLLVVGGRYQYYHSKDSKVHMEAYDENFRFVRPKDGKIELYKDSKWETLKVKGIELSSFTPGTSEYKSKIEKAKVMKWLEEISKLNANVIKITGIQSPSFYNAIYDYNEDAEEPILTFHEIRLNENAILKNYDAYHKKLYKEFKKDVKRTIDVVHGRGLLSGGKNNFPGIYLKDISRYNLGYILGPNTTPELISLSNLEHPLKNSYDGDYISLEKGSAFDVFVAEMLDFATKYETEKYNQVSLMSYSSTVETDSLDYKYETNRTKNAKINMNSFKSDKLNNLFVAYKFHPNSADFLDYEYRYGDSKYFDSPKSDYYRHLKRIDNYYEKPVLISDLGISTSRVISEIDLGDGFNRGGWTEKEQGENIVKLLESIYSLEIPGGIVGSWQDSWTRSSPGIENIDYLDKSMSSFWHNTQVSDESFGLISFELDEKHGDQYLNGSTEKWDSIKYLIDEDIKLKVRSEPSYLYLLIEKEDLSFEDEDIFLGINITPNSGSNYWNRKEVKFKDPVDFILDINGYEWTRFLVHERYNLFDYMNKYYSPVVNKMRKIPDKSGDNFDPIYKLNRKKFYFPGSNKVDEPIFYESGILRHGTDDPNHKDFDSLGDFKVEGDFIEIKIPWNMINVKNPFEMLIYDDFFINGVEDFLKISSIGFSIIDKNEGKVYEEERYRQPIDLKRRKYDYRLKESYYILKDYWRDIK